MRTLTYIKIGLLYLFCFWSVNVFSQKYSIDEVPNVHLKNASQYVSDPEHFLSPEYLAKLNQRLQFMNDSLSVQCAALVLPGVNSSDPNTFAHDLLNKWGVGNKETDKGLVILLLYKEDRGVWFATGYGLEGDLPDVICKRIQIEKMVPLFKENNFGEGLLAGVNEVIMLLNDGELREQYIKETKTISAGNDESEENDWFGLWVSCVGVSTVFILIYIFGLFLGVSDNKNNPYKACVETHLPKGCLWIALIFSPPAALLLTLAVKFLKRKSEKRLTCVSCGANQVEMSKNKEVIKEATTKEKGIERYTFVCRNCQHIHKEDIETPKISTSSRGTSSRGTSSSSGGSWGGGSSGGGGAGTRF